MQKKQVAVYYTKAGSILHHSYFDNFCQIHIFSINICHFRVLYMERIREKILFTSNLLTLNKKNSK